MTLGRRSVTASRKPRHRRYGRRRISLISAGPPAMSSGDSSGLQTAILGCTPLVAELGNGTSTRRLAPARSSSGAGSLTTCRRRLMPSLQAAPSYASGCPGPGRSVAVFGPAEKLLSREGRPAWFRAAHGEPQERRPSPRGAEVQPVANVRRGDAMTSTVGTPAEMVVEASCSLIRL
jgi:hypothetical protein